MSIKAKKIVALFIGLIFIFSFSACNKPVVKIDNNLNSKWDKKGDIIIDAPLMQEFKKAPIKKDVKSTTNGFINVQLYGATPNDELDDTDAINYALTLANGMKGILYLPKGNYIVTSGFRVNSGTTVCGEFIDPYDKAECTTIFTYGQNGLDRGTSLFSLSNGANLKNLRIYYPQQSKNVPIAFPFTISQTGENVFCIENVFIVNPYKAIDFASKPAGRSYIKNFYAQPIMSGIELDSSLDTGRFFNIQLKPFWSKNLVKFTKENATGITFRRVDWQEVDGVEIEGYKVGIATKGNAKYGPGNPLMRAVKIKDCVTSLQVLALQGHSGLTLVDSELQGMVSVSANNTAPIKMLRTVFDGTNTEKDMILLAGSGTVIFEGCTFKNYDLNEKGNVAINCNSAKLIVTECDFKDFAKADVSIRSVCNGAIVKNNKYADNKLDLKKKTSGVVVSD